MFGILVFWPGQEVWYLVFWYFGSAVGAGVWCFVTWRTPLKHRPGSSYRTSIASSAAEGPKRMAASAVVAVPSVWCRGSGLVLTVYSLFTHDTLLPTQHRTSYKATRSTVVARILEYW